jgi:hypothetical protein
MGMAAFLFLGVSYGEWVAFGSLGWSLSLTLSSLGLVARLESRWYGMDMETDVRAWGVLWEGGWSLLSVVYIWLYSTSGLRPSTAI